MNTNTLSETASLAPVRGGRLRGGLRDWQRWAPYAAVAWSLGYAVLGIYWAVSGGGFPYAPRDVAEGIGPMVGQFGPVAAWIFVIAEGIPAAAVGAAMLRGERRMRPLLIAAGTLFGAVPLLMMVELNLLIELAYIPFGIFNLLTGTEFGGIYLESLYQSRWTILLQVLCLTGGFLWLAATLVYTRQSGDACPYCGRRDGPEGWNSPANAARWGRIAVYAAMVVPVFYGFTRYAWALGIPLGMTEEHWRQGQASGEWISGLFLANFGLLGAVLTLGLVQRWGEVFPRWMIGLAGRRVPMALAVVPAAIMSVLLMVGGIAVWSGLAGMSEAAGETLDVGIIVGPVLLFPAWSIALAAATLGYYYRRRGPCDVCARGASGTPDQKGENS